MKKIYWKPEVEIIEAELQQMIALSTIDTDADPAADVLTREFIDDAFTGGDAMDKAFFD